MNRPDTGLAEFIQDYLNCNLAGYYEAQQEVSGEELAEDLVNKGYCCNPYLEYDRALTCPVNKRKESFCNNTLCNSYDFCRLLRREGYV